MLELYFKYPGVLRRLRGGALGAEMDRIAAHFAEIGYKHASAKIYIARIGRFSAFAARNARSPIIDQATIDLFLHSLRTETARIAARTAVEHARRVAPERFSIPCRTMPNPHGPLLAAYLDHLRKVRGLEPKTCEGLLLAARRILDWYNDHVPGQPLAAMTGARSVPIQFHAASTSDRVASSVLVERRISARAGQLGAHLWVARGSN